MKKKILYLMLVVCPLGFLSANNKSHYWPPHFYYIKKLKVVKENPQPKQETDFELGPGSWLL